LWKIYDQSWNLIPTSSLVKWTYRKCCQADETCHPLYIWSATKYSQFGEM
jgi:hypothetical protein